jgi:hypothetical protein
MDILQRLKDANYTGIVRIIQRLGDAGALFDYFHTLGLPFLLPFMMGDGMFVAGSFVTSMINKMGDSAAPFEPNDMDLWIPCQDVADGEQKLMALQSILGRSQQYRFPHTVRINNNYGRLGHIATLITDFVPRPDSVSPLIKIQAILLKPDDRPAISHQQKAIETIRQFDFSICKACFVDFQMIAVDPEGIQHAAFAQIGVDNDVLQKQSTMQWIRTEVRMRKYINRGYRFQEASSLDWWTLLKHVLVSTPRVNTFVSHWNRSSLLDHDDVDVQVVVNTNIFTLRVDMDHPLSKLYVEDSEIGRRIRLSWGRYSHEYRIECMEPLRGQTTIRYISMSRDFTRYMSIQQQRDDGYRFFVEYEETVRIMNMGQQEDWVLQQSLVLEGTEALVHGDAISNKSSRSSMMVKF